jgi:hypothetical protein
VKLNHSIAFEFEGKSYEIRICSAGWKFNIRTYLDGKPANGYSYNADLPTVFDLEQVRDIDTIQELVKQAKKDVENKTWEKLLNHYLEKTKTSEGNGLGCQNCTSRNIESRIVDSRKMYECKECGNIWYEISTGSNGYEAILHDITSDVEEEGVHETFTVGLLNTAFREDSSEGLSFQDQLKNWAKINKLEYSFFRKKDSSGTEQEAIKFNSRVPRVSPPFLAN